MAVGVSAFELFSHSIYFTFLAMSVLRFLAVAQAVLSHNGSIGSGMNSMVALLIRINREMRTNPRAEKHDTAQTSIVARLE